MKPLSLVSGARTALSAQPQYLKQKRADIAVRAPLQTNSTGRSPGPRPRGLPALIAVASLVSSCVLLAEDLSVFTPQPAGEAPRQMVGTYLKQQAYQALERRREAYEQVKTPDEAKTYRERLRQFFLEQLGGFPERTPLNPRIVGALEGDGCKIEKIIYESQPRHFVTALLYLPASPPPFPAVLMPCGHSATGKTENQIQGIFLAKNGIAALCYDPIGQGERYQLLDGSGQPRFKATDEHTLLGAACILLGRGTATYRVWDGMRSLDYLASRTDIDAARIGVSGCSGGGTLSSYLMALDDRIACAAPSCYLTSFRRLIDTIGPQDAEQNIHGQIGFGMDHADYILMRAPKPTLMLTGTQDFFDIQGSWDTFRQAARWYTRLGFPERMAMVETDTKHGYPQPQREAMVRWMRRWLLGQDQPVTEPAIKTRPADELLCTPRGQALLLDGARSVVELNVELSAKLEAQRRKIWEPGGHPEALAAVRSASGIRPLASLPKPRASRVGAVERQSCRIEKLILEGEPGIRLPALLFQPVRPSGRRYLWLNGEGKHADAGPGGAIEKLVQAGHVVLAPDLRGIGETGPSDQNLWGGSSKDFFLAYLLGRSMLGMRAEDVLVCARFLAELEGDGHHARVHLISLNSTGPAALHAAALERELFDTLKFVRSLQSWTDVVRYPAAPRQLINVVHGALHTYDLPDLLRLLPQDKVTVEEPLDLRPLAAPKNT
ncbi:MAG: acetylxylan esterase [Verrucomicrobia bacterium]|nr:acetylxylan esterase [Verrucomicrobiota bacterium]